MPRFRVGGRVRVIHLTTDWMGWVDPLKAYLGKWGIIETVAPDCIGVLFDDGNSWKFPAKDLMPEEDDLVVGDKVKAVGVLPDNILMAGAKVTKRRLIDEGVLLEVVDENVPPDYDEFPYERRFIRVKVFEGDKKGYSFHFYRYHLEKVVAEQPLKIEEIEEGDAVYVPKIPERRDEHPHFTPEMEKVIGKKLIVQRVRNGIVNAKGEGEEFSYNYLPKWLMKWKGAKGVKKPKVKKPRAITKTYLQEKIKEAREHLKQNAKPNAVCNYSVILEKKGKLEIRHQVGDVCHARMGSSYYDQKEGGRAITMVDWIADMQKRDKEKYPMFKKFVKYVVEQSPCKGTWVTKRAQDALKYGLVLDNTKPTSQAAFATILMRQGREYLDRLPVFDAVVSAGYSGHAAIILASALQVEVFEKDKYVIGGLGGHSAIYAGHRMKDLIAFFSGKKTFKPGKPYKEQSTGWEVYAQIGPTNGSGFVQELMDFWGIEKKGFGAHYSVNKKQLLAAAAHIDKLLKEA